MQFKPDPRFEEAKAFIRSGVFGKYNYNDLLGSLEGNEGYGRGDYFLVGKDFPSYIESQDEIDEAYKDTEVPCFRDYCAFDLFKIGFTFYVNQYMLIFIFHTNSDTTYLRSEYLLSHLVHTK